KVSPTRHTGSRPGKGRNGRTVPFRFANPGQTEATSRIKDCRSIISGLPPLIRGNNLYSLRLTEVCFQERDVPAAQPSPQAPGYRLLPMWLPNKAVPWMNLC